MRPLAWGLLLLGGAIALAVHAAGQDLSAMLPDGVPGFGSWIAAQKPPDPAYERLGMRAGSFLLFPELTESSGYNSNVLGGSPALGTGLIGTHASLQAKSDWRADQLGAYLGVDDLRTPGAPKQARTDWAASLGGLKQFGTDALTLGFAHFSAHEDRTQIDALPSDAPIPYSVEELRVSYSISLRELTITPSFNATLYRYGAAMLLGQPVAQNSRDRNVFRLGLALDYQIAPGRDLLLVGRGLGSRYTVSQAGVPNHNSAGWELVAGVDDRIDGLWRVRVLAGWQQRRFSSPAFRNQGALAAEADAIWTPDPLVDVTLTLSRTMQDAAQESTAAYVATGGRLSVGYQWRRNIRVDAAAGMERAKFAGTSDVQTGLSLGAGLTWWLNRRLNLRFSETITGLRGSGPPPSTGSYTRSVSLITIGFGL